MAEIQLTDSDNGKSIKAAVGDVVALNLTWNPSTGYFWQSSDITAGELIELKHEGGETKPGESTHVVFKVKIKGAGVIEFMYARPWSETESPGKWFVITVSV